MSACYLQRGISVGEGDVVLDVGANVGVAAIFFASVCRAGVVHSFEPVAPVFELLSENIRQFSACRAHPYGLSRASGEAEITYYPGASAMSGLYADPSPTASWSTTACGGTWGFPSRRPVNASRVPTSPATWLRATNGL